MKRAILSLTLGLLVTASLPAAAQMPTVAMGAVATAVAGSQPVQVIGMSAYSGTVIFTGQMRVVASLNANMPVGTTLAIRLTAPSGGTSLGDVIVDVTPRNLVTAATPPFFTNVTIRYTLTPSVAAGVLPLTTRTVTYTLMTWP